MISVINYGMGNIGSILNMFKRIGLQANVVTTADEIFHAKKLLLPGVGSFDAAMKRINESGIREALDHKALKEQVPVFGICLGMQLLTHSSEEGVLPGLGWVDAKTLGFKTRLDTAKYKVPHMGWSECRLHTQSPLFKGFEDLEEIRFYFVHSFFVQCENSSQSILKTNYSLDFDSSLQKDNIFGAQFHPEKSHKFGMRLLENFGKI